MSSTHSSAGDVANIRATPALPMSPTSGRERLSSASSTPISFNQMTDYEWLEREEIHLRELEEARSRTAQMEKTMRWWSDCTANWREKWSKVRNERNKAIEENRTLRNKMDAFVKEATEHKREKQELLNEIDTLKQKIEELNSQPRLSKENLDSDASPQGEANSIEDITPNVAGNTVNNNINNNLEETEYDADQEELGVAAAAADGGSGSVENHYGKLELHVDSPVATLAKSGARDLDSNVTKLEESLSLVTLKLEESHKSLQMQHEENHKLSKQVDQLQEELSQLKTKYEEIKQSKIDLLAELDRAKVEHKDEVSRLLLELEDEQDNRLGVDKKMADLRKELEILQSENASEWAKRERLETDKLALERESKKLRTKIEDLEEQLEQKNQQAATLIDSDMRTMQFDLSEKNKELSELRHAHAKLKKIHLEKHTELDHTRRRAEQYELEVKKLRSRIEELKRDLASAEDEADLQANNVRKLQRTNEEYEEQVGNLQVQVEHLQSRLRRGNAQACLKSRSSQSLKSFTTDEATTLGDSDENAMDEDLS